MKNKILILLIGLGLILSWSNAGQASADPNHHYPRLVNLYWKTPVTKDDAKLLAQWDMLVLSMAAQLDSAEAIRYLRQLNPDIIILAYTSATEIPKERLTILEPEGHGLWHQLIAGLSEEWYLKTYDGQTVSWWPGNVSMNLYAPNQAGDSYADYLADFYDKQILASGLWDGLLFDTAWNNIDWFNPALDLDGDGQKDSGDKINRLWQIGHQRLLENLRHKIDNRYLLLINGDGNWQDLANGRMFESFPEYWDGGWTGSMEKYQLNDSSGQKPRLNIINSDSNNSGRATDYQTMRYGLTSALLFDGYFSFDHGTELREQFWWYDEYDVFLGRAKNSAVNLLNDNSIITEGVWQRDFENGVAIVNSTDQQQALTFDSEYEKLHGQQDPLVNDGSIINQLDIKANDGIILLRPIEQLRQAVYQNGSFARIFDQNGRNTRTGFFSYQPRFKGGSKIIETDLDNNGQIDIVAAVEGTILLFKNEDPVGKALFPFGEKYSLGLSIAVADVTNDSDQEIIVGAEIGQANLIKIYNANGQLVNSGWSAYNSAWKNLGVNLAAGDINGDGQNEIVVGAGVGGGPHIRIFSGDGRLLSGGFFAYDKNFRGGVNLAVGDINGDGIKEIITGPGVGGGPHLAIFNARGELLKQWLAYDSTSKSGIKVTASDLDGDKIDEIIILTTKVFTLSLLK